MLSAIKGLCGEYAVISWYLLRLYKLLKHRFIIHKHGEIDLILCKNNILVFVEVKFRSDKNFDDILLYSGQKKRIIKTAKAFLYKNPEYSNYLIRFDFAFVSNLLRPTIIKNAFNADCLSF